MVGSFFLGGDRRLDRLTLKSMARTSPYKNEHLRKAILLSYKTTA
jgi:hypothetical protein